MMRWGWEVGMVSKPVELNELNSRGSTVLCDVMKQPPQRPPPQQQRHRRGLNAGMVLLLTGALHLLLQLLLLPACSQAFALAAAGVTARRSTTTQHQHQQQRSRRLLWMAATRGGGDGASSGSGPVFEEFSAFIQEQQRAIIAAIEEEEANGAMGGTGAKFKVDPWEREDNAGRRSFGATCVLEGGSFIEKGAVSVSVVRGVLSKERAAAMSARGRDLGTGGADGGVPYAAAALSLVLHSANPHLPTFRSDVRYFECAGKGWFGGGADLTPYYLHDQDVKSFHALYKGLCDAAGGGPEEAGGLGLYRQFKKTCDDYFYLPARKEHRGTGGIFFDDLERLDLGPSSSSAVADGGVDEGVRRAKTFTEAVARAFMPSYLPIVRRRRDQPFTEEQRQWMLLRRGRYLEFNLLYDRGVKFGLAGGRFESVMVSAPPLIAFKYDHHPPEGSEEARLVAILKEPKEWV